MESRCVDGTFLFCCSLAFFTAAIQKGEEKKEGVIKERKARVIERIGVVAILSVVVGVSLTLALSILFSE